MAANQWGVDKSIFLFSPSGNTAEALEVIINPEYKIIASSEINTCPQDYMWEACFSVPLAAGKVARFIHIRVRYQNEDGEIIKRNLEGWPARVWQHENDHLNGILYDDLNTRKCIDKRSFNTREEIYKFYDSVEEERKKVAEYRDSNKLKSS